MKYRTLGKTGFEVSEIGFGAWAIGGNAFGNSYGSTRDSDSLKALEKALTLGCNFFDTADVYGHGHSEEILARILGGRRQNVFVATKVGADFYQSPLKLNFSPKYIRSACEKSLQRLNTTYIDLYQLHNPPNYLLQSDEIFEPLYELKKEGLIRAIGLSIFHPEEGLDAIKRGHVDCIQVVYNILNRQAGKELLPAARERNIGIIAREPLQNALLTGKFKGSESFEEGDIRYGWSVQYFNHMVKFASDLKELLHNDNRTLTQAALQFVLAQPAVSTVIPGMKNTNQVKENLKTTNLPPMTEKELSRIIQNLMRH